MYLVLELMKGQTEQKAQIRAEKNLKFIKILFVFNHCLMQFWSLALKTSYKEKNSEEQGH